MTATGTPASSKKTIKIMKKGPPKLYTLQDACNLFFSNVPVTVRDLRKEARRGRLVITRINRHQCVSEQAIREMLVACRERPVSNVRFGLRNNAASLSMEAERAALASLRLRMKKPDERSGNTSKANVGQE